MTKGRRRTSRKCGALWRLLLLLPWLDIGPNLPGNSGDHQLDKLRRAREEIDGPGQLRGKDLIPHQPGIEHIPKKNLARRAVEWMSDRLKRKRARY